MFTGIIEAIAKVKEIRAAGTNITFVMESEMASSLKVDQSLSHNGCCLTVEKTGEGWYEVTAIDETLKKTNLGELKSGDSVNLERSVSMGTGLDGHIVQGHVDTTGKCISKISMDGSAVFTFEFPAEHNTLIVEKGSICVNGVSLTAYNIRDNQFSVAIIPYTITHTTFQFMNEGDIVNIEFDIIGKYVRKWMESYKS